MCRKVIRLTEKNIQISKELVQMLTDNVIAFTDNKGVISFEQYRGYRNDALLEICYLVATTIRCLCFYGTSFEIYEKSDIISNIIDKEHKGWFLCDKEVPASELFYTTYKDLYRDYAQKYACQKVLEIVQALQKYKYIEFNNHKIWIECKKGEKKLPRWDMEHKYKVPNVEYHVVS